MDDRQPLEELPADLLARLRDPVEVDPDVVDAQIAAALAEMDSTVVPFRRAHHDRRRWLPVAAVVVAVLTVGGAILAGWRPSPSTTADQAGRAVESFDANHDDTRDDTRGDRVEGHTADAELETSTGPELAPRLSAPTDSIVQHSPSEADDGSRTMVEPMARATSQPRSCQIDNWWDKIRALFSRCA